MDISSEYSKKCETYMLASELQTQLQSTQSPAICRVCWLHLLGDDVPQSNNLSSVRPVCHHEHQNLIAIVVMIPPDTRSKCLLGGPTSLEDQ